MKKNRPSQPNAEIDIEQAPLSAPTDVDAESRYRALADSSPVGTLIHDGTRIIDCNVACAHLFGYSHAGEMCGVLIVDIIAEEAQDLLHNVLDNRLEGAYVFWAKRKNGSKFLMEGIGRNCTYQGKPARVGSVRDITERDRYQRALLESEQKFKSLFDRAPIGMALSDLKGKFIQLNPAFCRMLGYSTEELLTKSIADITHPDDQTITPAHFVQLLQGELGVSQYEKRYLHKDRGWVWVECHTSISRDESGQAVGFFSQVLDLTERRRSEASLREMTHMLQNLINSAPLAIFLHDQNGIIEMWNPEAERVFGWTAEEAIGKFLPFVSEEALPQARENIALILSSKKVVGLEATRKRKDGSDIIISISAVPIKGPDGEIRSGMAIVSDVSQAKAAERELRVAREQAELAAKAKSEFLANMSHEIRTPLNGILGMTGLLLDTGLDHEQRGFVETLNRSASSLLEIINDILDFSKIEAGKMHFEEINFDLRDAVLDIDRMMAVLAEKKGIQLITDISSELPRVVCGDPGRFRQILLNLVGNAIKFTNTGSVRIKAETLKITSSIAELRFEVADSGIGIAPEILGRLFQAFTQADNSTARRYGGTGLGLSISKKLIEHMGGAIGAHSEVGKGSTFWFTARLKKGRLDRLASASATPPDVKPVTRAEGRFRILVAEDNPVNQLITVKMLEKAGFRVDAVANGKEVLASFQQFKYDLILMDCQMPEMDGYEATQSIRTSELPNARTIPIIALTANAMPGDTEKCLSAGMDDYLAKPITYDIMIKKVNEWLVSRSSAWLRGAI